MKRFIIIISIMLISVFSISGGNLIAGWEEEALKQVKLRNELIDLKEALLTMQNVDRYITLRGVIHKDIVLRQVILESGWLKSELTTEGSNLLGMKLPVHRPTTAIGTFMGHARYKHWTDSIEDYILWRDYWISRGHDTTNYYKFLANIGYAEDPIYIAILKSIELT